LFGGSLNNQDIELLKVAFVELAKEQK